MSSFIRTLVTAAAVFSALSYLGSLAGASPMSRRGIGGLGAIAVLTFGHIRAHRDSEPG